MRDYQNSLKELEALQSDLHGKDFLLTWEFSTAELKQFLYAAEVLREFRGSNISARCFDSGLAITNFRDQSTRTRFAFFSAADMLGLALQDLDEARSQITHGETVRETASMISFLAEVIGIRDDIFLGAGHAYMQEVASALQESYDSGVLPQRPGVVNLQSDVDHPTQSMADLLHLIHYFGSLENLKGKKIAVTWAYSPSYGKPLSVPQGVIGLMSRFGMNVTLAHPEGYRLIPEVTELAGRQTEQNGGRFQIVHSMEDAFENADVVYPKSWAPYQVMEKRTELLQKSDREGLKALEKGCLAQNARFKDWECTPDKMKLTCNGRALYMHCLPADISGVSCQRGEVENSVFDRYRVATYQQAGWKPYIIASIILNNRFADPAGLLRAIEARAKKRVGTTP